MKALKITIDQEYLKGEEPSPEEISAMIQRGFLLSPEYQDAEYVLIFAYCEITPNRFRGKSLALHKAKWKVGTGTLEFSTEPADKDIIKKCVNKFEASRKRPSEGHDFIEIIDLDVWMHFAHGVQKEHILSSLDYLTQKGKTDERGIRYVFNQAHNTLVMHDGKKYAPKEVMRIAYCHKESETPSEKNGKFSKEQYLRFDVASRNYSTHRFTSFLRNKGFEVISVDDDENNQSVGNDPLTQEKIDESIELLQQFYQIILYGPPGTGKTYTAQKILAELLSESDEPYDEKRLDSIQGEYWDIVQFHPSYNYEDFVRGIKVETLENKVAYKTVNRIFGDMCERADNDETNRKYALIIDEINRANVSAVLGELIYALEPGYRNKSIQTPYTIDSDDSDSNPKIVIPKNLYIIGTMNTADRTIGQIDYAVRRRFAFVHCLPDENVINDDKAKYFFSLVEDIFRKESKHLPSDSDPNDVRIGHSYFMASGKELSNKILYQVVPILREYVKDGVLMNSAEKEIDKIEEEARKLGK